MIANHLNPSLDSRTVEFCVHQSEALTHSLDVTSLAFKELKLLMRRQTIPVLSPLRSHLWTDLCSIVGQSHDTLDTELHCLAHKLPHFVDPTIARFYHLNEETKRQIPLILWNLSQIYPSVTFSPLVYPLVSLFLHFHSEQQTFQSICSLLNSKKITFLGKTKSDKSRDAIVLIKLTKKFGILRNRKLGSEARNKLRNNAMDSAFADFHHWIFALLPFEHCVRIVDCFLIEGEKFLYRICLTLCLMFEKETKQTIQRQPMKAFCEHTVKQLFPFPTLLVKESLRLTSLSHKDISKARMKAELKSQTLTDDTSLHSGESVVRRLDIISNKEYILGARIAPRRFKSNVLTWNQLDVIYEWIPERIVVKEPEVLFCSEENGNSLKTFYSLCGENEPTIIVIKTIENEIFGAFCSSAWSKRLDLSQTKSGQYFGTGETFLFTLTPLVSRYEWVGRRCQQLDLNVEHAQQLFQSATNQMVCIGSGGGKFGLLIDESLSRGETDRCLTFENKPLTGNGCSHFSIAVVEVIGFS